MTLAVIVIAVAGFAYLHSTTRSKTQSQAQSINPALPTISPLLVSAIPVEYDFVTPSVGWASLVAVDATTQAVQFQIYRTTDGAKHWQQQLAGPATSPGFWPITVQLFGKGGFMTVGAPVEQLFRTADGGVHWDPLVPPFSSIDAVTFSSATSGWLVAYTGFGLPGPVLVGPGQSHLYATSDAGQTWQSLPDPPAGASILASESPTEAWMGSFDVRTPHVYSSSDRGRSWQRHALPGANGTGKGTTALTAAATPPR